MPAAARNLAAIQQWFLPRTSRTERFRVLAAYAAGRGWSRRAQRRMLAALIAKQSTKHAFALYAERDRRIGGNNRWYAVERTKDGVIVRTRRWRPSAAELLSAGRTILGDSIDEPSLAPNAAREVVVPHSRWMAFKWRVVGSPVARRFRSAAYAMHRDLPTIAPAEWRARRGRGALEEWRAIVPAGGESLPVWLARSGGRRRIAALEAAGRLLADSLARGLIMRTLAADRMGLLDLPGRPVRVYWDGVEAATRRRPATVGQAGWVLAELLASVSYLALTRTDCAHLLRAFARRRGEDWRRWWRMLAPQMSEIK